jgi:hypothetical protein
MNFEKIKQLVSTFGWIFERNNKKTRNKKTDFNSKLITHRRNCKYIEQVRRPLNVIIKEKIHNVNILV